MPASLFPPHCKETHSLDLIMACDITCVGQYRARARAFLERHLGAPDHVEDMEVIIDEALTNIINHSCGRRTEEQVQLQLVLETMNGGLLSLLSLVFIDRGPAGIDYRPEERVRQTRSDHAKGDPAGFGLVLLYNLMDMVDYHTTPQGTNRLVLRKWFCQDDSQLHHVRRLVDDVRLPMESRCEARRPLAEAWARVPQCDADRLIGALESILGTPTWHP